MYFINKYVVSTVFVAVFFLFIGGRIFFVKRLYGIFRESKINIFKKFLMDKEAPECCRKVRKRGSNGQRSVRELLESPKERFYRTK